MLALTLEAAKNVAIIVVIVLAAIALVTARFVTSIVMKAVALLLFAALALGVWTQRQDLQTCADKVEAAGAVAGATCTFFGNEITIKAPQASD